MRLGQIREELKYASDFLTVDAADEALPGNMPGKRLSNLTAIRMGLEHLSNVPALREDATSLLGNALFSVVMGPGGVAAERTIANVFIEQVDQLRADAQRLLAVLDATVGPDDETTVAVRLPDEASLPVVAGVAASLSKVFARMGAKNVQFRGFDSGSAYLKIGFDTVEFVVLLFTLWRLSVALTSMQRRDTKELEEDKELSEEEVVLQLKVTSRRRARFRNEQVKKIAPTDSTPEDLRRLESAVTEMQRLVGGGVTISPKLFAPHEVEEAEAQLRSLEQMTAALNPVKYEPKLLLIENPTDDDKLEAVVGRTVTRLQEDDGEPD